MRQKAFAEGAFEGYHKVANREPYPVPGLEATLFFVLCKEMQKC